MEPCAKIVPFVSTLVMVQELAISLLVWNTYEHLPQNDPNVAKYSIRGVWVVTSDLWTWSFHQIWTMELNWKWMACLNNLKYRGACPCHTPTNHPVVMDDIDILGVSRNTPKWLVYRDNPIEMDENWGYPYFRKPPFWSWKPMVTWGSSWRNHKKPPMIGLGLLSRWASHAPALGAGAQVPRKLREL